MTALRIAPLALLALLLLPLLSLAQENQPTTGAYCPHLTRDLKYGDTDATTGGQVTELQKFLHDYYEDYPDWAITGNFRSTTRSYVQRFQREQNLPAFGYVGPLTRAAIARVCGTQTTPPTDNPPSPPPPQNQSCTTPWRTTIQSGTSVVAYQSPNVPQGQQCQFENRYCQNGTLTGSYQYQNCEVQANTTTSCIPEAPQTQTLSCPTGQTGAIIQTRTSSCPGPTWGPWVTTSNTCTTSTDNTQPPTVSLTVNGQRSITLTPGALFTLAWSSSNATSCNLTNAQNQTNPTTPNVSGSSQGGAPAAGQTYTYTLACTNNGGTTTKVASVTGQTTTGGGGGSNEYLSATPTSGTAPLAMTLNYYVPSNLAGEYAGFALQYDGITVFMNAIASCAYTNGGTCRGSVQKVYAVPGTYVVKLWVGQGNGNGINLDRMLGSVTIVVSQDPMIGSCVYKGERRAEGTVVTIPRVNSVPMPVIQAECDHSEWVLTQDVTYPAWPQAFKGRSVCVVVMGGAGYDTSSFTCSDSGGALLAVVPRHGRAPLSVTIKTRSGIYSGYVCPAYTLSWGDGSPENYPERGCDDTTRIDTRTHTYVAPGSYTISYNDTEGRSNSAPIRVDAATASSGNQSQLASALAALESALEAFLKLLGQ